MPKVSEEHRDARRQHIILAAYRCFGEKGFHKTTMRDICREADLSPGAVYNYFPGKDDILEALAECGRETHRSLVDSVEQPEHVPAALAAVAGHLVALLEDREVVQSSRIDVRLWGEAIHTPRVRALLQAGLADASARWCEIVNEGLMKRELAVQLDADAVSRVVLALFMGLQVQKVLDPGLDIERCGDVVRALLSGYFVAGRGSESHGG